MTATITKPLTERRGILNPSLADTNFILSRHLPCATLQPFVDWYWIVTWNLPAGTQHVQEVMAHPCVNATLQRGASGVFGPVRTRDARWLEGAGRVIGVKFKPAGFAGFSVCSLPTMVGRRLSWLEAFNLDDATLEAEVLGHTDHGAMVHRFETILNECQPVLEDDAQLVNDATAFIAAHPEVLRVTDLSTRLGVGIRQLERLFKRFVGLTPKWIIRQHRLFEAATRLERDPALSPATLSLELGYFDQAHFAKDFKAVIGESPAAYAERCAQSNPLQLEPFAVL